MFKKNGKILSKNNINSPIKIKRSYREWNRLPLDRVYIDRPKYLTSAQRIIEIHRVLLKKLQQMFKKKSKIFVKNSPKLTQKNF